MLIHLRLGHSFVRSGTLFSNGRGHTKGYVKFFSPTLMPTLNLLFLNNLEAIYKKEVFDSEHLLYVDEQLY